MKHSLVFDILLQKLLPWCSPTFVVVFKNFCRGVHKLLLWRSQTFAVITSSLFCCFKNTFAYLKTYVTKLESNVKAIFLKLCSIRLILLSWYLWATVIMWAILPIRERRCQDIDQVLLHEIIVFLSQCFQQQWSARQNYFHSDRLQLAGLGKKREETVKPTCFSLLHVESDFGTTGTLHRHYR